MNTFTIIATSDLHGDLQAYMNLAGQAKSDEIQLVVLAGDLTGRSNGYHQLSPILSSIGKKVLFLMGNMDEEEWPSEGNLININQRSYAYEHLNFVGYQYTNPFIGGKFEKSESEQYQDLNNLSEKMDDRTVFITHGPPFGVLDKTFWKRSVGSKSLTDFVARHKPLIHIFGHIHESFGRSERSYNVSYPSSKSFVKIDCLSNTWEIVK